MKDYICSIDIGSSRCKVLVARDEGPGQLNIIGVGASDSQGVKDGVIVNIEAAVRCISEAAREAELMSGLVVDEAFINITGKHVKGENSRGVVAITNKERLVTESDVYRVIEGAQNIRIPADQEIIHVLSREFHVDDQDGIRDPVGMSGVRLEAEVHIVTAGKTAIMNLARAVSGAEIKLSDVVMSSLASSEAVLADAEKDLGIALVDIGSRITDVALFIDGGVCFSSTVPLGGGHVSHDLSIGLKIPL
ncbi:MAG: cell division protein FtsA, partial [Spirochaetia bacterium]|nr:cell division protein FtsA [Spirochaetia bacterium]